MLQIHVTLLGRFAVTVGGVPVADASWKRRHAAAVVKVLALAPGRRLHREQVIDLVSAAGHDRRGGTQAAQGGALRPARHRGAGRGGAARRPGGPVPRRQRDRGRGPVRGAGPPGARRRGRRRGPRGARAIRRRAAARGQVRGVGRAAPRAAPAQSPGPAAAGRSLGGGGRTRPGRRARPPGPHAPVRGERRPACRAAPVRAPGPGAAAGARRRPGPGGFGAAGPAARRARRVRAPRRPADRP